MALSTPASIAGRVQLRSGISENLARDMVTNAFRDLFDRRMWSWLVKPGQFIVPTMYQTGTASSVTGSTYISGVGTNWDQTFVGRQFRFGVGTPIYDIVQVLSPTLLVLNLPYGDQTMNDSHYFIYQCYYPVPNDFHSFLTVVDTRFNFQLKTDVAQETLNLIDAQRANFSVQAYVTSFRDYTIGNTGLIQQPFVSAGNNIPCIVSPQATYNAPINGSFIVTITTGGTVGTGMMFAWVKVPAGAPWGGVGYGEGGYGDGGFGGGGLEIAPDPDNPVFLQDGVGIFFDPTVNYLVGDQFVITCIAQQNPGLPRYELWPHNTSAYQYQFLYESRPNDVFDPGFVLPVYIAQRGDALFEGAMANVARWPGTESEPNVYFNLQLAKMHDQRYEDALNTLMRQDEEVNMVYLKYGSWLDWGWTPMVDSYWMATHAL